jgi:hypothetical protein
MSYEPRCTICREPVNLTESKTDENGQAVHENCYVWCVELKKPRKPVAHPDAPSGWLAFAFAGDSSGVLNR